MKLIIDIDDKDYEKLKDGHIPFSILDVVQNGAVLPKGHGRLIDADSLRAGYNIDLEDNLVGYRYITKQDIDNAPTILEADKEGRRDEAN